MKKDFLKALRLFFRVKNKSQHIRCCERCHFDFEEEFLFPYLSEERQQELADEHEDLKARGNPFDEVMQHAEKEVRYYIEAGVPDDLLESVEADHLNFMLKNGKDVDLGGCVVITGDQ